MALLNRFSKIFRKKGNKKIIHKAINLPIWNASLTIASPRNLQVRRSPPRRMNSPRRMNLKVQIPRRVNNVRQMIYNRNLGEYVNKINYYYKKHYNKAIKNGYNNKAAAVIANIKMRNQGYY